MTAQEGGGQDLNPVKRLTRDLAEAAKTMTREEARFLVDSYYMMQEDRKRAHNQVRAMEVGKEPHSVISWLAESSETLEKQIKRALDKYTDVHPVGSWAKGIVGIGPVLSAGLVAHIDITKAQTAGAIWRFAGFDPSSKWEKGQRRPWNAELRTIGWKLGQSWMKLSNNEDCLYGGLYRERKELEVNRNDTGGNTERSARILTEKNWNKSTEAFGHLSGGKLPPAQIDAMARRWVVKLFLSHLQMVWWFIEHGKLPADPYCVSHVGHTHIIQPPNTEVVEGFDKAWKLRNYAEGRQPSKWSK